MQLRPTSMCVCVKDINMVDSAVHVHPVCAYPGQLLTAINKPAYGGGDIVTVTPVKGALIAYLTEQL